MLYYMALEVLVKIVSQDLLELEPKEPYEQQKMVNKTWDCVKGFAEEGWKPEVFKRGSVSVSTRNTSLRCFQIDFFSDRSLNSSLNTTTCR